MCSWIYSSLGRNGWKLQKLLNFKVGRLRNWPTWVARSVRLHTMGQLVVRVLTKLPESKKVYLFAIQTWKRENKNCKSYSISKLTRLRNWPKVSHSLGLTSHDGTISYTRSDQTSWIWIVFPMTHSNLVENGWKLQKLLSLKVVLPKDSGLDLVEIGATLLQAWLDFSSSNSWVTMELAAVPESHMYSLFGIRIWKQKNKNCKSY